jgi:hypothetical protein
MRCIIYGFLPAWVASALFGYSLYWLEEGRKPIPIATP